ncbi:hypothetical protein QTP88_018328 [Uroleucon formosanum]
MKTKSIIIKQNVKLSEKDAVHWIQCLRDIFNVLLSPKLVTQKKTKNLKNILHSSSSTDSSLTYKSFQQVQENASTSEINTSNDNNVILPIDIDLNFNENHIIMSNKKKKH